MWRLWRKSPEGQTVLESSKKERYYGLPKKRTREDGLRKKVSRRSKSSRKGKFERRRSLNGQTCAERKACLLLSAVGSTGMPVARVRLRWRMRRWRVNIESVAAGQNRLVNVRLAITMVRIQTVGQDEQAEKQWRCVDPCKSNHYESGRTQGISHLTEWKWVGEKIGSSFELPSCLSARVWLRLYRELEIEGKRDVSA